jgi:hypothetical protein
LRSRTLSLGRNPLAAGSDILYGLVVDFARCGGSMMSSMAMITGRRLLRRVIIGMALKEDCGTMEVVGHRVWYEEMALMRMGSVR